MAPFAPHFDLDEVPRCATACPLWTGEGCDHQRNVEVRTGDLCTVWVHRASNMLRVLYGSMRTETFAAGGEPSAIQKELRYLTNDEDAYQYLQRGIQDKLKRYMRDASRNVRERLKNNPLRRAMLGDVPVDPSEHNPFIPKEDDPSWEA